MAPTLSGFMNVAYSEGFLLPALSWVGTRTIQLATCDCRPRKTLCEYLRDHQKGLENTDENRWQHNPEMVNDLIKQMNEEKAKFIQMVRDLNTNTEKYGPRLLVIDTFLANSPTLTEPFDASAILAKLEVLERQKGELDIEDIKKTIHTSYTQHKQAPFILTPPDMTVNKKMFRVAAQYHGYQGMARKMDEAVSQKRLPVGSEQNDDESRRLQDYYEDMADICTDL